MAEDSSDDAYEITDVQPDDMPAGWETVAVYTLELPVRCPSCKEPIRTLRVVRLSRTQVAFTSTLPRNGRAFICPQCERLLSVELSGIL
jgi:hypothetical protein